MDYRADLDLAKPINAAVGFEEIDGTVKVENLLSLQIGENRYRYIYPYFCERPPMSLDVARLGLWLMSRALPELDASEMRILDVLRGQAYALDDNPLTGDEEQDFTLRYRRILREWRQHFR